MSVAQKLTLRPGQRLTRDEFMRPPANGVYRSQILPGLWLDGPAILKHDMDRVMKTLQRGLASPQQARFIKTLAARKKANP